MMSAFRQPAFFRRSAVLLCLMAFCLGGCFGSGASPYGRAYSAGEIAADPSVLTNAIVANCDISGLRLQNLTIKDATFLNTTASGAWFRNVTFDNCRFLNAKFTDAVLDGVTFKGGIITCEMDAGNTDRRSEFVRSQFTNLVLDGTYLENPLFNGTNGTITFRNVRQAIAVYPLVTGTTMHLVLEGSIFRRMTIAEVYGASTLVANNCIFEYAYFGKSTFSKTHMGKNIIYGGPVYKGPLPSSRRRR